MITPQPMGRAVDWPHTLVRIALLLFGTSGPTAGQSLIVGTYAGSNGAWHTIEGRDLRIGATLGVTFERPLNDVLTLQAGTWYTVKGSRDAGDFEMTQKYVEFPVLVRLSGHRSEHVVRPVLLAGLAPAFEVACDSRGRDGIPEGLRPLDCRLNRTNKFDFGVVLGGGVDFWPGSVSGSIELRYTHGIFDTANQFRFVSVFNRSISLLGGIRIAV